MDTQKPYELPQGIKDTLEASQLFASFGLFVLWWQAFEEVLECIICREARLTRMHATIIVSGLGFERKASIARSLLALKGDRYAEAISLINRIANAAERNALVHGQPEIVGKEVRFLKWSTDQKLKAKVSTFDAKRMYGRTVEVQNLVHALKAVAGFTPAQDRAWDKTTKRLLSKVGTSPKPPSS